MAYGHQAYGNDWDEIKRGTITKQMGYTWVKKNLILVEKRAFESFCCY